MIIIRSSLYFIAMVLSIVFWGFIIAVPGRLFSIESRQKMAALWGRNNLWLLKTICGLDYRLHGAENLPQHAAIIMSKHQSAWETITFKAIFHHRQAFVLKQELMRIPIFGWALAAVPNIPIDRGSGRQALKQIITQGTALLKQDHIIIIFPEGTRTAPGQRGQYNIGGAMLAQKSGYPVVPVAHNAGVFWRKRGLKKYPGTIDVVIGEPFDPSGMKAGEIIQKVENWIEEQLAQLPQEPR